MILPANGIAFDNPGAARGDLIGLRRIDADATVAGNQAFRFDDSEAAGTLRCVDDGAVTRILGFIDGVAGGGLRASSSSTAASPRRATPRLDFVL